MKIILSEPYGYCAGVDRAINIALKTKQDYKDKKIVILGMLVHNQDALNELADKGILTIYHKDKTLLELCDEIPSNSVVILTAHGHSDDIEQKLDEKNIKYIDATCPFVTATFNKIKKVTEKSHEVLYIGKANHPESNAALSISKLVHLVDISNPTFDVKDDSPLIINQTTFSQSEISEIDSQIKNKYPGAEVFPSVCKASTDRQNAILNLPKNIQLIYVVGGKNSNNTKTLANLARKTFPDCKVIEIQNKFDINKKDLIGLSCIAICSGASTPKYISEQIRDSIQELLD